MIVADGGLGTTADALRSADQWKSLRIVSFGPR
jgi:hypothetical protein